jgi:hypothetical protein
VALNDTGTATHRVTCVEKPHGIPVGRQVRVPKGWTVGVVRHATVGVPGVAVAVIEMSASTQTSW